MHLIYLQSGFFVLICVVTSSLSPSHICQQLPWILQTFLMKLQGYMCIRQLLISQNESKLQINIYMGVMETIIIAWQKQTTLQSHVGLLSWQYICYHRVKFFCPGNVTIGHHSHNTALDWKSQDDSVKTIIYQHWMSIPGK